MPSPPPPRATTSLTRRSKALASAESSGGALCPPNVDQSRTLNWWLSDSAIRFCQPGFVDTATEARVLVRADATVDWHGGIGKVREHRTRRVLLALVPDHHPLGLGRIYCRDHEVHSPRLKSAGVGDDIDP